jgi:hypothetical protein
MFSAVLFGSLSWATVQVRPFMSGLAVSWRHVVGILPFALAARE